MELGIELPDKMALLITLLVKVKSLVLPEEKLFDLYLGLLKFE